MSLRTASRLFAIVIFIARLTAAQTISTETATRIDALVARTMADQHIPALSVAVAVNGQIQYQKAFGKADLENDIAAAPETLFRTGSIAKSMTAVAALRLVDEGKLDLDAPVQKYCPAFPKKQRTITTRQLLGHLSGIRHYNEGEIDNTHHYAKLSDGFAIFANDRLLFEPGTGYHYTTYGFSVIGCALEGATGKSYPDVMQQEVFVPAHMTHTFVDNVFTIVPRRARGYSLRNGQVINAGLMDSSYKIPGGGYVSTPGDLVTLADDLLAGTLLQPGTLKLMWTSQKLRDGTSTGYGLGWGLGKFENEEVAGHSGAQQGTSTSLTIYPARKLAVAVMMNMDGLDAAHIDHEIGALLLKDLFGVEPVPEAQPKRQ
ncbi:MAG: serine hydrolase domain-containing protein [Terriglobales bacterium]|jgi:serine beta-lactamase-like protein LACTB